ncbi:hypothetical protein HZA85_02850 [Candidatus Uhrbacteria bacterium]|nr:hypothetical protein [Candidatus Uhrbacteria bacterium]
MNQQTQATLAKTGFYVSFVAYVCFWFLDLLRPGFVSRTFSVHVFLLASLLFGIWWSLTVKEYVDRPWVQMIFIGAFGLLVSVVTWASGQGLGALRVLVTVLVFFVPLIVWNLIRH